MPGERKFSAGCEDAHVVVRAGRCRRQEKRRLGEVGPARKRGHLRFAHSLGGMHYREWISAQWICREDIDLPEGLTHPQVNRFPSNTFTNATSTRLAGVAM